MRVSSICIGVKPRNPKIRGRVGIAPFCSREFEADMLSARTGIVVYIKKYLLGHS